MIGRQITLERAEAEYWKARATALLAERRDLELERDTLKEDLAYARNAIVDLDKRVENLEGDVHGLSNRAAPQADLGQYQKRLNEDISRFAEASGLPRDVWVDVPDGWDDSPGFANDGTREEVRAAGYAG